MLLSTPWDSSSSRVTFVGHVASFPMGRIKRSLAMARIYHLHLLEISPGIFAINEISNIQFLLAFIVLFIKTYLAAVG